MDLVLLLSAFFAGALTVLAPCTLPILPLIIGGSSASHQEHRSVTLRRALVMVASLAISVFCFSLLLRASTVLLAIPQQVWSLVAGGLVIALGLHFLMPDFWARLATRFGWSTRSNQRLFHYANKQGWRSTIVTGAALGPVFNSCSPTYALIIALILPRSLGEGVVALAVYVLGMSAVLLAVAYFGSRLTQKLGWTLAENGVFRRVIGVVFVLVGVAVISGLDKDLQAWLLERGAYDGGLSL